MKLICKLFGHKNIFIHDEDDESCGKYCCERCGHISGGVGKVIVVEHIGNHAGNGGGSASRRRRKMSEWISVKEQKPVVGQYLLFCGIGNNFIPTQCGAYLTGDTFFTFMSGRI